MQKIDKQNKTSFLQHLFIQKLIKYQLNVRQLLEAQGIQQWLRQCRDLKQLTAKQGNHIIIIPAVSVMIDIASQFGWYIIFHPIVVGIDCFGSTEDLSTLLWNQKECPEESELDVEKALSKGNSTYESMKAFAVLVALGWGEILNVK